MYMQITNKTWAIAGVIVVVVAGGWQYYRTTGSRLSDSSVSTSTPNQEVAATSTPTASETPTPAKSPGSATEVQPFSINAADTITSWNFKGDSAGSDTLIQQANADIQHLTSLLGKGEYDDYDLYDGIANDYALLGSGEKSYQNFNRAIAIHPAKGLGYVNLAHLMEKLRAFETAADAYKKAVTVEPGMLEYHVQRLNYLTRQFAANNTRVAAAFADASKQFGDNASILMIEAQWLTDEKRYADAVAAWEQVKVLSPGKDTASIDAEIARLKAKQ
jgi:tetratricopeptide (TPR) repeat protein